ncbi:MAG: ATP-binding cassette domain-containing protein [Bacilli bacterium]|nr:ATP-binding cassette domain-containing protein [Bacilli bacterium]
MYKLVNVSKYYSNENKVNKALDNINLEIKENEFVVISGPSGSGKSTLLNILSGIDYYQEGEMFFNNKPTSHFDELDYQNFRNNNISFVFQEYNLIDSYTVKENILIAYNIKNIEYSDDDVIHLLKRVGLEKKINVKASKLSGGEKARLAIARALALNNKVLVLDEPTGALDSTNSIQVVNLLNSLKNEKTIIVVTHNEEIFNDAATHKIKIVDGKIKDDILVENINISNNKNITSTKKITNNAMNIARLNIKNQPKKSLLSFFLALTFTLFIVLIISNLSYMSRKENTTSTLINSEERIIVNKDTPLTKDDEEFLSKYSNIIVKESSLLDANININFSEFGHLELLSGGLNASILNNSDLAIGTTPNSINAIVLPYSSTLYNNFKKIDQKIYEFNFNESYYIKLKIVGISNNPYYYFHNDLALTLNKLIENRLDLSYSDGGNYLNVYLDLSLDNFLYTSDDSLSYTINNKIVSTKIDSSLSLGSVKINPQFYASFYDKQNYQWSIYVKDPLNFVKKLTNYEYFIPNVKTELFDVNRVLVTFMSVIMAVIIYFLIVLKTIVTRQIFKYKNKDNAILSSFGYTSSLLTKSMYYEIGFYHIISLLIFIILTILDYTLNIFKGFLTYNNLVSYLIMLIIIVVSIVFEIHKVMANFDNLSLFKKLRGGENDA